MSNNGLNSHKSTEQQSPLPIPMWLLAEVTYACPLQCAYCSNPVNFPNYKKNELTTQEWGDLFSQARKLGTVQLGISGGEPMVRPDIFELVEEARQLGFYSNLITSGIGLNEEKVQRLKLLGLDHIQISFQAGEEELNNTLAGTDSYQQKKAMARAVKAAGYPMVLNFVLHRQNLHQLPAMLHMAKELEADYVELANTQYYGWALKNRDYLLPSKEQLIQAEQFTNEFREMFAGDMQIFFVIPDYFEGKVKPCSNGWGTTFITAMPDGSISPCQSAHELPNVNLPNIRNAALADIWQKSELFNLYRGQDWMSEPCRSCDKKYEDFGGCRCQAYLLTGKAENTDPVCELSPQHSLITELRGIADASVETPVLLRNSKNARII